MLKASLISVALKAITLPFNFMVSVALARLLGGEGYGVYAYAFALITLVTVPAQLGLPQLVVRETAVLLSSFNYSKIKGLWIWSGYMVFIICGLLLPVYAYYLFAEGGGNSEKLSITILISLGLAPLIALSNVRSAAIRGINKPIIGQLPESLVRPSIFLFLLMFLALWAPGEANPMSAMFAHVTAALVAYCVSVVFLRVFSPKPLLEHISLDFDSKYWLSAAVPLAMISGLQIINSQADVLILGAFSQIEDVGIYKVSLALSALMVVGLQAVNPVVNPRFARLYSQNRIADLQRVVTRSARLISVLTLIPLIFMIFYGREFILLFYGDEYIDGFYPAVVLMIGQGVNAVMGSVAGLLNMTGHEKDTFKGVAISAVTNLILNLVLVPPYGMAGAAIATSISMVVWNIILWRFVKVRLGVRSTAFGF